MEIKDAWWLQSLYSKQRNAGKSNSMSRFFLTESINTVLEDLGQINWLFASWLLLYPFLGFSVHSLVQTSRIYPPLFCSYYFHNESTIIYKFLEIRPFFMNAAVSMKWVNIFDLDDLVFNSYYQDFSPNYFEYRLRDWPRNFSWNQESVCDI